MVVKGENCQQWFVLFPEMEDTSLRTKAWNLQVRIAFKMVVGKESRGRAKEEEVVGEDRRKKMMVVRVKREKRKKRMEDPPKFHQVSSEVIMKCSTIFTELTEMTNIEYFL